MACLQLFIDLWDTSDVFMSHNPSYVPLESTCLQLITTLEIIWCIFSKPKSGFKSGKPRRTSTRCNLILRLIVVHCIAVPEPQWHQNIKPAWAIALSAKLMYGNEKNDLPDPTVRPVFSLYLIFFGFRKQQLHSAIPLEYRDVSEEEKLVLPFSFTMWCHLMAWLTEVSLENTEMVWTQSSHGDGLLSSF